MTHSLVQGKNNSGYEGTPQTDLLRDSSVNHALIAIAQEITELLKQTYPIQTDEIKTGETE
ncbi:hypothetical protein [Chroococcidiopsis thermalis]|uniref:Uncharacterized protein n=1 Tax=Chroococcidiopsis thermalis (strain PCC 7203) TaxID=251229 RepID=K9U8C9_CHRTP|nr:hypothetical protein [Chroococcidiopsis thermalis]AFY91100.1 hypothetical protein Chro_5755 [Chroococcidiopsis thermalis PCC 7203]